LALTNLTKPANQPMIERLILVTSDKKLAQYGMPILLV
jgi:hypothetical protein